MFWQASQKPVHKDNVNDDWSGDSNSDSDSDSGAEHDKRIERRDERIRKMRGYGEPADFVDTSKGLDATRPGSTTITPDQTPRG